MDFFGGKKEASTEDILDAISTILDRLGTLENRMNVIEERYETLAKEQASLSSGIKELRSTSGESLADLMAKVKTLSLAAAKLNEESKRLARLTNDLARQDELIELRKRVEMGR